ncbi:hypothetical protein FRC0406_00332 [Corynebacterium diphtheriae]|nr:hypothetical protein FRC0406_00332 [Corynebacterium diphtheriae]
MSLSAVIERSGSQWQHPRIMKTTGQISHTGTSDYPDYRGYSQGNGPGEGGRGGNRQGDCAGGGEAADSRSLRGG